MRLTGRMAAWGQTKAQMLHWVQEEEVQAGTLEAMARSSMAVVPGGKKPPGVNTLQEGRTGRRCADLSFSVDTVANAHPHHSLNARRPTAHPLARPVPPTPHLTGSLSPSSASMGRTTLSRNSDGDCVPAWAAAASAAPRRTGSCSREEGVGRGSAPPGKGVGEGQAGRARLRSSNLAKPVHPSISKDTLCRRSVAVSPPDPQQPTSLPWPQPWGISMGTIRSSALSTAA